MRSTTSINGGRPVATIVSFMLLAGATLSECGGGSPAPYDGSDRLSDVPADGATPPELQPEDAIDHSLSLPDSAGDEAAPPKDTPATPDGCSPVCQGKQCGDDGCGGSCGGCNDNELCEAGMCVCQPLCDTIECGVDGCGGSCGECADGEKCKSGLCVCQPECGSAVCGPDGCGGACGQCRGNEECLDGACEPLFGKLGDSCVSDADCESLLCLYASGAKSCTEKCAGPECPAGFSCESVPVAGGQALDVCLPCTVDCVGKECGDDGCGGICGACELDEYCKLGKCSSIDGEFGDQCFEGADCISTTCMSAPGGKICTIYCDDDEDCPQNSSCQVVTTYDGASFYVCLP